MKATATRIESTRSQDIADRETQIDVELFIQWVDAQTLGEKELAEFYSDRFSDRLAPAFKAWIAKDPLENSAAPESPLAMRQYTVASSGQRQPPRTTRPTRSLPRPRWTSNGQTTTFLRSSFSLLVFSSLV